jgi:hypothetical protein
MDDRPLPDLDVRDALAPHVLAERLEDAMRVVTLLYAPFTTSDGSDDPNRALAQQAVDRWLADA